eukprot:903907-Rhodomonas_salina.1
MAGAAQVPSGTCLRPAAGSAVKRALWRRRSHRRSGVSTRRAGCNTRLYQRSLRASRVDNCES